jgi:hypothetical protein
MKNSRQPHTVRVANKAAVALLRRIKKETGKSQTRIVEDALLSFYSQPAQK